MKPSSHDLRSRVSSLTTVPLDCCCRLPIVGSCHARKKVGKHRAFARSDSCAAMDTAVMASFQSILRNPPMRLYLLGHGLILLGAWLMDLTGSILPMGLGAS